MSTLFNDTFTGTNGTALSSHTPNTDLQGAGWTNFRIDTEIQSNRASLRSGSGDGISVANVGLGDVTVSADLVVPNANSYSFGIIVRFRNNENFWLCYLNRDSGGTPYIAIDRIKTNGGGLVTLDEGGTTVSVPGATNSTVSMTVLCSGSTIKITMGTSEVATRSSDAFLQNDFKYGTYIYQDGSYTGGTLDNFLITGTLPTGKMYITGGTTFHAPADWPGTADTVETIGAGGGGSWPVSHVGSGGGGGAYSKATSVSVSNGATLQVGQGGDPGISIGSSTGGTGGDTWFNGASLAASSVGSKGGTGASDGTAGVGGDSASGVGSPKYSGGAGGGIGSDNRGAAGGGGAAGPSGIGRAGGNGGADYAGSGGGGGAASSATAGSVAGNGNTGGAGGTAQDGTAGGAGGVGANAAGGDGSHGSGGGGGGDTVGGVSGGNGGVGGDGVDLDSTHGAGGGGGGGGGAAGGGGDKLWTYCKCGYRWTLRRWRRRSSLGYRGFGRCRLWCPRYNLCYLYPSGYNHLHLFFFQLIILFVF